MKKHPVYRLMDGQIMCQRESGGRWLPVDEMTANGMLEAFAGLRPETIRSAMALPIAEPLAAARGHPGRRRGDKQEFQPRPWPLGYMLFGAVLAAVAITGAMWFATWASVQR